MQKILKTNYLESAFDLNAYIHSELKLDIFFNKAQCKTE